MPVFIQHFFKDSPLIWIGPVLLGFLAFFGVFARGLANSAYVLLALWGIIFMIWQRRLAFDSPLKKQQYLPGLWLIGLLLYVFVYFVSALAGVAPLHSLAFNVKIIFLLATFPLVWLALEQRPQMVGLIPLFYGAGLIMTGFLTFREADYCISCIRAKSSLGVIELGAVLGQIPPILVGALALAQSLGQRKRVAFYLLALVAGYVAILNSCARIAILVAPFLSLIMYWVHRRVFTRWQHATALILVVLALAGLVMNGRTVDRFRDISKLSANHSNEVRFTLWRHGLDIFKKHPVLGLGPASLPYDEHLDELVEPDSQGSQGLADVQKNRPVYSHAHQVFINVLAEAGLLGLLGFLALHLAPLAMLWSHRKSRDPHILFWTWAAFVVALQLVLNGLTDQVFSLKPLMYIYWTVTAVAIHKVFWHNLVISDQRI